MAQTSFATQVRTAIRDGVYQPKSKLDLVMLAALAEKTAATEIGAAVTEILAFSIQIDHGTAHGMKGGAFIADVAATVGKLDPFKNPIFVRIPSNRETPVSELLALTRSVVGAQH
jgi:hypothetical protein